MLLTRWWWTSAIAASWFCGAAGASVGNRPGPLSVPSTQLFEGDDGWWSTFFAQIGSPSQSLHLIPGTSVFAGTTLWAVLSEGCWEANPGFSDCDTARGGVFTRNQSTSWSTERLPNSGLLGLGNYEEQFLGSNYIGSAYYGFDTVTLGTSGLTTLENQLIAGIGTNNYFLGSLGLSPLSFNISDYNSPVPSLLGALYNQSIVPSRSWAYTAGASYHSPQTYGSLTLGGYDLARVDQVNSLGNISFSADTSRDLQIQLRAITYNTIGSTPLLADPIDVFFDSFVSQMWLPIPVCQSFEEAFNLTWNSTYELYLVDETVHNALVAQNPQFNMTFADPSGSTVSILLPYAAFDLNVTLPITTTPTRYFPLQRAQNFTQYTFGRVFLQEAYLVADYERRNFSLSQALPASLAAASQLVPICAPGNEADCRAQSRSRLTGGVIAGIAVGATALALVALGSLAWLWRRRRRSARARDAAAAAAGNDTFAAAADKKEGRHGEGPVAYGAELDTRKAALYEMDPRNEVRPELGGREQKLRGADRAHEMGTGVVAAYELEARVPAVSD